MAFGIPNIERIVSNFIEGGTGITAIRNVEYSKNFLWTVDFIGGNDSLVPPAPFDQFFPASDCTLNLGTIVSQDSDHGPTSIRFPRSSRLFDMTMTFYDDDKNTLMKWFRDWINLDILNAGLYTSGLNDSHPIEASYNRGTDSFGAKRNVAPARHIRLAKLDAWRNEATVFNYRVYPQGDFNFTGDQSSSASQYSISFAVVEDMGAKVSAAESGGFSFQEIKNVLGRFL